MSDDVEKKILYLSRSIALMRDLTGHLSQAYAFDYGRQAQDGLDRLITNLDEAVILFDQVRDQCALEMVDDDIVKQIPLKSLLPRKA